LYLMPGHRFSLTGSKPVSRVHKSTNYAGLSSRMAGIRNDTQVSFRPRSVKFPRTHDRTHNVVTALNDDARYVPNLFDVINQVVVGFEEDIIYEVVTLDSCQSQS